MVIGMNYTLEALKCPNCGAAVKNVPNDASEFKCEYCGILIHINRGTSTPVSVGTVGSASNSDSEAEKLIRRIGRLIYLCKDTEARCTVESALYTYPDNVRLMELENQCDCFATKDFGNYLKMLAVRTFLLPDECARYQTEIAGFCRMVGDKAINTLNFPTLRKQNTDNYLAILSYIEELKRCLRNNTVINSDTLYETVRSAVLKLMAVVCNTIYVRSSRANREYSMLISLDYRRKLKAEFDTINSIKRTVYQVVDESIVRQYIPGGF